MDRFRRMERGECRVLPRYTRVEVYQIMQFGQRGVLSFVVIEFA